MPKLWSSTVEAHRREVEAAILAATADLVAQQGPAAVTMSQIAERAGIGRATLYKYFPDVRSVLTAWHSQQVGRHLHRLAEVRDGAGSASRRLEAVLEAYAALAQAGPRGSDVAAFLHRGRHVAQAEEHVRVFLRELIADGARAGELRDDVPPDELAGYCLHALSAAGNLSSEEAVARLVRVTLAGLRWPG